MDHDGYVCKTPRRGVDELPKPPQSLALRNVKLKSMLAVSYADRPRNGVVHGDDYIPLSVNWVQVGSVRPVYYRIRSSDGGDVELKIEPLRGELIGAVVIDSPARRVGVPKSIYISSRVAEGAVFISRTKPQPG